MKRLLSLFLVVSLLSACALRLPPLRSDTRNPEDMVSVSSVCVLVPVDLVPGSGDEIVQLERDALRKIGLSSVQVSQLQSGAYATCLERGAKTVLQTTVLAYEDRPVGWLGKPDRVELLLSRYEINRPETRRSIVYEARTNMFRSAILDAGGAKPTDLLADDFARAVVQLMGSGEDAQ
jgi:hypothetical protein